jgi:ribosomal protein S27E
VDLGKARSTACKHCGAVVKRPGINPGDSLAGEVGFAELSKRKLSSQLDVVCPECKRTFIVDIKYAGQRAKCSACGAIVDIPLVATAPASPTGTQKKRPASAATPKGRKSSVFDAEPAFGASPSRGATPVTVIPGTPVDAAVDLGPEVPQSGSPRLRRRRRYTAGLVIGILLAGCLGVWGMISLYNHVFADNGDELRVTDLLPNGEYVARITGNPRMDTATPSGPASGDPPLEPTAPRLDSEEGQSPATAHAIARPVKAERSLFALEGYGAAPLGREFWRVTVQIEAEGGSVTINGQDIALTCGSYTGTFRGIYDRRRPFELDDARLSISEGMSRVVTFVFEMPSMAVGPEITVHIGDMDPVKLETPSSLTSEDDLGGTYYEVPPRNLRPILADPVMKTLQTQMPGEIILTPDGARYTLAFPGCDVTGVALLAAEGMYRTSLTLGDDSILAFLRQAGPDRLVLYLADAPFHQITFARGEAVNDLAAIPQGVVPMNETPEQTPVVPPAMSPPHGPTVQPNVNDQPGRIFNN